MSRARSFFLPRAASFPHPLPSPHLLLLRQTTPLLSLLPSLIIACSFPAVANGETRAGRCLMGKWCTGRGNRCWKRIGNSSCNWQCPHATWSYDSLCFCVLSCFSSNFFVTRDLEYTLSKNYSFVKLMECGKWREILIRDTSAVKWDRKICPHSQPTKRGRNSTP